MSETREVVIRETDLMREKIRTAAAEAVEHFYTRTGFTPSRINVKIIDASTYAEKRYAVGSVTFNFEPAVP